MQFTTVVISGLFFVAWNMRPQLFHSWFYGNAVAWRDGWGWAYSVYATPLGTKVAHGVLTKSCIEHNFQYVLAGYSFKAAHFNHAQGTVSKPDSVEKQANSAPPPPLPLRLLRNLGGGVCWSRVAMIVFFELLVSFDTWFRRCNCGDGLNSKHFLRQPRWVPCQALFPLSGSVAVVCSSCVRIVELLGAMFAW